MHSRRMEYIIQYAAWLCAASTSSSYCMFWLYPMLLWWIYHIMLQCVVLVLFYSKYQAVSQGHTKHQPSCAAFCTLSRRRQPNAENAKSELALLAKCKF
ncbi:hypothetical protein BX667DRAFT_502115 [Coemansia mojavensis]|nr:hypothetical protein BX667DRAFT_504483 [Coemansia mojavensis]KAI9467446.1 hypothetical protein BX667DRAFT_504301 [Coemansia mojavensis]KAI9469354.1 hypothetical protein BX667DRAFT_502115 [Coemansia mojavensis]